IFDFFFTSRRRHTRFSRDWSSDVCSSDLGFEGDFSVLKSSVNEILNPDFIEKELDNNFVELKKTRFKTVFANDILKDARNAWVRSEERRVGKECRCVKVELHTRDRRMRDD